MSTRSLLPRYLILDIDGVLTDGSDSIHPIEKKLYLRDLDSINRARREGLTIAFLTGEGEDVAGPIVERCGGGLAEYGAKDKVRGLKRLVEKLDCTAQDVCYVADGERDVPALELVGLGLVPSDASNSARAVASRVLRARGGRGAVEQAIALLLSPSGADTVDIEATIRAELKAAAEFVNALAEGQIRDLVFAAAVVSECLAGGRRVVLFGNGGSAAMAQHLAAEIVGRFRSERRPLPAMALSTDTSVLTALANDYGYECLFARQVEAHVRYGDVAIGMSTSGRSINVVRALVAASELGAKTIALVGTDPGPVGDAADYCLTFPASDTARIQELHLTALHAICAVVDSCVEPNKKAAAEADPAKG